MIPSLCPDTGHLPPGRYQATLDEVYERFVCAPAFADSPTRQPVWQGFLDYLSAWYAAEDCVGSGPVLLSVWLAGSFISSEPAPSDLDITPVVDRDALVRVKGRAGSGMFKKLISDRRSVEARFKVEPFPLKWVATVSTLRTTALNSDARDYLETRGGLDDWWQRIRPDGPKEAPTLESAPAKRGYLEVAP